MPGFMDKMDSWLNMEERREKDKWQQETIEELGSKMSKVGYQHERTCSVKEAGERECPK